MTLPRLDSCTWDDQEAANGAGSLPQGPAKRGPEALQGRELHLWAVYANGNQRKKKRTAAKSRRKSLWAVVIIEELRSIEPFAYEVTLRRVFKQGERMIKVWVRNDPADQSDDARVFSILSPSLRQLTPLEEHLSWLAATRVYAAIAETWPSREAGDAGTPVLAPRRPTAEIAPSSEPVHNRVLKKLLGINEEYVLPDPTDEEMVSVSDTLRAPIRSGSRLATPRMTEISQFDSGNPATM